MNEDIKKEKLKNLDEELKMLQKIVEPFMIRIEQINKNIFLLRRVKKIDDTVEWEDHFGTHNRDTDYYSGKILEIDLEKEEYIVRITQHGGDSVQFKETSREIGKIVKRRI